MPMLKLSCVVIIVGFDGRGGVARYIHVVGDESVWSIAKKIARRAAAAMRHRSKAQPAIDEDLDRVYDTDFIIQRAHVRLIMANFDVPELADGRDRPFPELIAAVVNAKAPVKGGA